MITHTIENKCDKFDMMVEAVIIKILYIFFEHRFAYASFNNFHTIHKYKKKYFHLKLFP